MSEILIDITILELLHKKVKEGSLLPAEAELLENWAGSSIHHRALADRIGNSKLLLADLSERYALNSDMAWKRVAARTVEKETASLKAPVRRINVIRRWWGAAAILLLAGIGTYFFTTIQKDKAPSIVENRSADIPAGKDGAVLTLADGSQVSLDSVQNATIALQGGVTAKVVDGTLIYEGTGNEAVYNTVSTPKGRKYRVILPDGTIAWLNAASNIRYPSAFSGAERKVELKGEAYFEVAKNNKKPFRVTINEKAEVQVLGTSFNIKAYDNEPVVRTTLLEGSVRVRNGKEEKVLRPGEQARMGAGIELSKEVDIDQVMAWKNGLFNFDGAGIEEIMKQLERWYDIEVIYENGIPATTFFGKISARNSLQKVLSILEKSEVKFRLENGRQLVILQ
jgi:ferric-dicitrate binding protein FerR (iron transport regulator)